MTKTVFLSEDDTVEEAWKTTFDFNPHSLEILEKNHSRMSLLKRKHDEVDSEDDEPSYGKQILPVANLPNDYDEEPMDGMQYLFTVRYALSDSFIKKSNLSNESSVQASCTSASRHILRR
jgi:hypothetical protein